MTPSRAPRARRPRTSRSCKPTDFEQRRRVRVRAFRCSRLTVKQRDMQRSARLGGWELISGFTPTGLSVIEVLKTPQEDGLTWRAPWSPERYHLGQRTDRRPSRHGRLRGLHAGRPAQPRRELSDHLELTPADQPPRPAEGQVVSIDGVERVERRSADKGLVPMRSRCGPAKILSPAVRRKGAA